MQLLASLPPCLESAFDEVGCSGDHRPCLQDPAEFNAEKRSRRRAT